MNSTYTIFFSVQQKNKKIKNANLVPTKDAVSYGEIKHGAFLRTLGLPQIGVSGSKDCKYSEWVVWRIPWEATLWEMIIKINVCGFHAVFLMANVVSNILHWNSLHKADNVIRIIEVNEITRPPPSLMLAPKGAFRNAQSSLFIRVRKPLISPNRPYYWWGKRLRELKKLASMLVTEVGIAHKYLQASPAKWATEDFSRWLGLN